MENLKCLIVDDEPPAIRLLEKYVGKVSFLALVGTTTDALEALTIVEQGEIDLMFLDIQMPNLTGLQLSKIVKGKTKIIFTTAYPQFALESYALDAVDYLLKPFDFQRFYEAVRKARRFTKNKTDNTPSSEYIFVKTNGKNNFEKVDFKEVLYVESLKNYVAFHLRDRQVITYSTLRHFEECLPKSDFIKIHRSYIVALQHIEKTDSLSVYLTNKDLPIGDTYRAAFFKAIQKKEL